MEVLNINISHMSGVQNLTWTEENPWINSTLKPYPDDLKFNENNLLIVIVYSILFVIGTVGNISVLAALRCDRRRRQNNRVDSFIVHLSVADLLVALLFMPLEIIWALTVSWNAGPLACRVLMIFRAFGFYLSSFILVAISLDRYFAVAKPLATRIAEDRGRTMLSIAWSAAILSSLPQGVVFHLQSHPDIPDFKQCVTFDNFPYPWLEMLYNIFNITAIYLLPLSVIIVCYSLIVCIISRKASQLKEGLPSSETTHKNNRRRKPYTWKWSPRQQQQQQQQQLLAPHAQLSPRLTPQDATDATKDNEDSIFVVSQLEHKQMKNVSICCCCCCCCYSLLESRQYRNCHSPNHIEPSIIGGEMAIGSSRSMTNQCVKSSPGPRPSRRMFVGRTKHHWHSDVASELDSAAVESGLVPGKTGSVKRMALRSTGNNQIEKARAKSLKMTIVIVFVFIICWTPYYLMSAWWWFHMKSASTVSDMAQKCLFLFAVSNSCVDPIVYGFFSGAFSRTFGRKKSLRRITLT